MLRPDRVTFPNGLVGPHLNKYDYHTARGVVTIQSGKKVSSLKAAALDLLRQNRSSLEAYSLNGSPTSEKDPVLANHRNLRFLSCRDTVIAEQQQSRPEVGTDGARATGRQQFSPGPVSDDTRSASLAPPSANHTPFAERQDLLCRLSLVLLPTRQRLSSPHLSCQRSSRVRD